MEQEQEIWKPIKGYEGLYEVSNLGRVRTMPHLTIAKDGRKMYVPAKIRTISTNLHGYNYVKLLKDGRQKNMLIHRALMEAFVPNPENKPFIDHINTKKDDNRLENLRWVTSHENTQNPITLKKIKDACTQEERQRQIKVKKERGTWQGQHVYLYTKKGKFVDDYETITEAISSILRLELKKARERVGNILKAIDNPNKTAYGYKWYSKKIEP